MKRFALEKLKEWKTKPNRKPLIIRGARQVGKTWLMKEFGRTCFENVAYVNFDSNTRMQQVFEGEISIERIVLAISAETGISIDAQNTLLIFDEVQEVPKALSSLKYFCENAPEYAIVAAGSLLGVALHKGTSFPVGKVDFMDLHPLTFQEFLCALGEERFVEILQGPDTDMVTMFKSKYIDRLREYYYVGGMPEVVQKYIDIKDFREVDRVQRNLLQGYQYDIAHYATAEEKVKAEKCYLSLAKQLLDKENHKFQYKEIEHGGRAQKYYSSVEWLLRADMVQLCKRVTDVRFDLDDYARDDFFRAYTTDLSLLMAMKDFSLKQHIVENTLAGNSKGGIYECAIADALYKKGYQIYFYKNDTTKREIDVIIQKDGSVVPIEVKSRNTRANSLKWLMKNNKDISYGYKFADGNIGVSEEGIITLPLYMIAFI